jgi:signal transduction histidine kinase
LKWTISTKLNISAAIGVCAVIGLIYIQIMLLNSGKGGSDIVARHTQESQHAFVTMRYVLEMRIWLQHLLLAKTPDEVDAAHAALKNAFKLLKFETKSGMELATSRTIRDEFSNIEVLSEEYILPSNALADMAKAFLEDFPTQKKFSDIWGDALNKAKDCFRTTAQQNSIDIFKTIDDVITSMASYQSLASVYFLSGDEAQLKLASDQAGALRIQLGDLVKLSGNETVTKALAALKKAGSNYLAVTDQLVSQYQAKADIVRERALPAANIMLQSADGVIAASKAAADIANRSMDRLMDENLRTGIGVGWFAVAVLLASAVYAMLGIARPVRKITAAMEGISKGNLGVSVPGGARLDEIGEQARTLKVLAHNLAEAEAIRANQAKVEHEMAEVLRAANEDLEERVAQRTAEVENARQIAVNALAVKTEFLSNISHELRTPMHAILAYSKLGTDYIETGEINSIREFLERIIKSAKRLASLLDQLLDFNKMDAGRMEYSIKRDKFDTVIEHALMEIESLVKNKKMKVCVHNLTADRFAEFDKMRMVQVMVNLMSNAIKFSPPESSIDISVQDEVLAGERVALRCSVADQGVGIPEAEREIVFSKFTQSSKTKTGAGGTGLGLAICRGIIEAHGGKIWAENNPPKGAVFSFVFPKSKLQSREQPSCAGPAQPLAAK